jgi:hypothetical protein
MGDDVTRGGPVARLSQEKSRISPEFFASAQTGQWPLLLSYRHFLLEGEVTALREKLSTVVTHVKSSMLEHSQVVLTLLHQMAQRKRSLLLPHLLYDRDGRGIVVVVVVRCSLSVFIGQPAARMQTR